MKLAARACPYCQRILFPTRLGCFPLHGVPPVPRVHDNGTSHFRLPAREPVWCEGSDEDVTAW